MSREWTQEHDPENLLRAINYALALIFKTEGPMPEQDADMAEQALSLIAGIYTASTMNYPRRPLSLRMLLIEKRDWMHDHPGEWPTLFSIQRPDQN